MAASLPATPETLSGMVEFGSPFAVISPGEVVADGFRGDVPYAPEVYQYTDADGQVMPSPLDGLQMESGGPGGDQWEAMTGFTGQHGHAGPVMHASEYLGGGMARWVLDNPGLYAVCAVECVAFHEPDCGGCGACEECCQEPAGWVLLRYTGDDSK